MNLKFKIGELVRASKIGHNGITYLYGGDQRPWLKDDFHMMIPSHIPLRAGDFAVIIDGPIEDPVVKKSFFYKVLSPNGIGWARCLMIEKIKEEK